jgi:hypothetical protein
MKNARFVVAAVLIFFAWKGADLKVLWPPAAVVTPPAVPMPAGDWAWVAGLKPLLPKMLPADREYMSRFYAALAFVLERDGTRESPIIGTTDQFVAFHGGSLRLAIDKSSVGKYPGLAEAIDQSFIAAAGADPKKITAETRSKLAQCSQLLSGVFAIGRDE